MYKMKYRTGIISITCIIPNVNCRTVPKKLHDVLYGFLSLHTHFKISRISDFLFIKQILSSHWKLSVIRLNYDHATDHT